MPSRTDLGLQNPNATVLRSRAATLRTFADTLERLLVTRLDRDDATQNTAQTPGGDQRGHVRLRRALLQYNLQQLHRAADDLRVEAHHMCLAAHALDLARMAGAPTPPAASSR